MSCMRFSVISPSKPGMSFESRPETAQAATAERMPPQQTKLPKRFENQACSMLMTWSKQKKAKPMP